MQLEFIQPTLAKFVEFAKNSNTTIAAINARKEICKTMKTNKCLAAKIEK